MLPKLEPPSEQGSYKLFSHYLAKYIKNNKSLSIYLEFIFIDRQRYLLEEETFDV